MSEAALESAIAELRRVWAIATEQGYTGEIGVRGVFRHGHCTRHGSTWGTLTTVFCVSERGRGRLAPEPIPPD